jgi:hypothetical protein
VSRCRASRGSRTPQKIVVNSVLSITKIIVIEDHKIYCTFLHIAFGSKCLLNITSDQIGSDINWRVGEDDQMGGEREPITISRWNLSYVSKPTQHTSPLTRSRLRSYRQTTCPQNQVRNHRITVETRINASKNTCETMAIRIGSKISSSPYSHFTKQVTGVFRKPPYKGN